MKPTRHLLSKVKPKQNDFSNTGQHAHDTSVTEHTRHPQQQRLKTVISSFLVPAGEQTARNCVFRQWHAGFYLEEGEGERSGRESVQKQGGDICFLVGGNLSPSLLHKLQMHAKPTACLITNLANYEQRHLEMLANKLK